MHIHRCPDLSFIRYRYLSLHHRHHAFFIIVFWQCISQSRSITTTTSAKFNDQSTTHHQFGFAINRIVFIYERASHSVSSSGGCRFIVCSAFWQCRRCWSDDDESYEASCERRFSSGDHGWNVHVRRSRINAGKKKRRIRAKRGEVMEESKSDAQIAAFTKIIIDNNRPACS